MIIKGKYVIFERSGLEYPVLFPGHFVKHDEIVGTSELDTKDKVVSAGFFSIKIVDGFNGFFDTTEFQILVWGKSVSLNVQARLEIDAHLIRKSFDDKNFI